MSWSDALPIVLEVKKTDKKLASLKAENESLKRELQLWKAGKELPEVGKYYFAGEKILENHGWSFDEGVALRYEGTKEKNVIRFDGTTQKHLDHIFTAPYTYDHDDAFGRTGWIKLGFETYELHQVIDVEWEACPNVIYLDENDRQAEWNLE
jgi:hypothetical protein